MSLSTTLRRSNRLEAFEDTYDLNIEDPSPEKEEKFEKKESPTIERHKQDTTCASGIPLSVSSEHSKTCATQETQETCSSSTFTGDSVASIIRHKRVIVNDHFENQCIEEEVVEQHSSERLQDIPNHRIPGRTSISQGFVGDDLDTQDNIDSRFAISLSSPRPRIVAHEDSSTFYEDDESYKCSEDQVIKPEVPSDVFVDRSCCRQKDLSIPLNQKGGLKDPPKVEKPDAPSSQVNISPALSYASTTPISTVSSLEDHMIDEPTSRMRRLSLTEQNSLQPFYSNTTALTHVSSSTLSSDGHMHNNVFPIPAAPSYLSTNNRSVKFTTITIRHYNRVLGDNPSCSQGPSLSIGWDYYTEIDRVPIKKFEMRKLKSRYPQDCPILTRVERESILKDLGYSSSEIADAVRANMKTKRQRRTTVNNLQFVKAEESTEKIKRKIMGLVKMKWLRKKIRARKLLKE